MFDNASARSAIECFLSECKRSPRCLQALAIQVDRCIARKSKMATKTIIGFREGLCTQYFRIWFSEWRYMLLCMNIWNETSKTEVRKVFLLVHVFSTNRGFGLSEGSLSFNNVMITLTSARWSARIVELAYGACYITILHRINQDLPFKHVICKWNISEYIQLFLII